MKTLYRILKIITPKSIVGLIQNQKEKLNILKGELHADETNSLLAQMYSAEIDNLFI
jgi:hypothetical protein